MAFFTVQNKFHKTSLATTEATQAYNWAVLRAKATEHPTAIITRDIKTNVVGLYMVRPDGKVGG